MRDLAEAKHNNFKRRSNFYYRDNRYSIHNKFNPNDYINIVKNYITNENYSIYNKKPWTYMKLDDSDLESARWKIHISASINNNIKVLQIVSKYAIVNQINFKFAIDYSEFVHLNSKNTQRVSSGKYIVLYPKEEFFEKTLEELYSSLKGYEGPYILTDKPYKDSKVIYYRYGEIMPISVIEEYGTTKTYILNKKNELTMDIRKPCYFVPSYIINKNYTYEENVKSKLLKKYKITESLHFTSQGGVYIGYKDEKKYLIKEARQYCGLDYRGNYGTDRLNKEYVTLKFLENLDCVPKPMELIIDCDNIYLVEEFIEGKTLTKLPFKQSPVVNCSRLESKINKEFRHKYINIFKLTVEALEKIHDKGVIFNDISPNNIMYDEELNKIYFIDYEACYHSIDECSKINMFTPGFGCKEDGTIIQYDLYKLGLVFLYCIMPFNKMYELVPNKAFEAIELLRELNTLPNYIYDILLQLLKFDFNNCREVLDYLDYNDKIYEKKINKNNSNDYILENDVEDILKVKDTIIENINPSEETMVACDPMGFLTSRYSLGYGIFGVLYALSFVKDGVNVEETIIDKIVSKFMDRFYRYHDFQTTGLYVGFSGIVVSLLELDYVNEAKIIMKHVVNKTMSMSDLSYGLAGRIVAELCMYKKTDNNVYLNYAVKDSETIINKAITEKKLCYWQDEQNDIYIGLTRGSSGIALVLLYMYVETKNEKYLNIAEKAFNTDFSKTIINDYGYISFNSMPLNNDKQQEYTIYSPYLHNGIAGLGSVALRFYLITKDEKYKKIVEDIIIACDFDLSLFPGYLRGTVGVMSFLQDCYIYLESKKAYNILCSLTHRIKFYRVTFMDKENNLELNAYVGDELLRISHDFFTGSAGIISVLNRNNNLHKKNTNPFMIMDKYYLV